MAGCLLLPALVFLFAFTHIPAVTTLIEQFLFHAARPSPGEVHRARQLRSHD
jgi:hypothetical protein